ncbi:MAG TPA: AAA family ATPase [Candidatus Binataceae bacterium]|nr:AAA family ATPase [Candidatus Binataceae bacterium]
MYYQHFGLNGPPFQFTPSPAMIYMSQTHREGMAALEWGLMHESSGFSLLIGESGTGKTTLIASLLSRQYQRLHLVYVTNPRLEFADIMRLILTQLGIESAGLSKAEMLDALGRFLGGLRPAERVAIIFDEAQGLNEEVLEELRLLSNYGRSGENQLQLIMAGQPELLRRLMSPTLRQFNERIGARTLLVPLDATETVEYIDYRLRAKGGTAGKIFHRKALQYIVAAGAGIPRRVNVLCHNAMLLAYAAGAKQVSLKMAKEAVSEYQDLFTAALKSASSQSQIPRDGFTISLSPATTALAAALVSLLIALMVFGAHFSRTDHHAEIPEMSSATGVTAPAAQTAPAPHQALDGAGAAAANNPIAIPDSASADNSESAAPSIASASVTSKPKRSSVRLAKQRSSDGQDQNDE